MTEQPDLFTDSGLATPAAPFHVFVDVVIAPGCAWCQKPATYNGGGVRTLEDDRVVSYAYCRPCYEKHGPTPPMSTWTFTPHAGGDA